MSGDDAFVIMEAEQNKQLVLLRVAVGLLGEQSENCWWSSAFCGTGGTAFLAAVFGFSVTAGLRTTGDGR